jgi:hypothetical protein
MGHRRQRAIHGLRQHRRQIRFRRRLHARPASGEKVFYGEFLINAQGEDVVAGVRTPKPVAELAKIMPAAAKELEQVRQTLESHFRDVQDFEFTIEDGKSSCSKPATANAPAWPPCASPSKWKRRN